MRGKKKRKNDKASALPAVVFFLCLTQLFPLSPIFVSASEEERREELLIASFSTEYDEGKRERAHNIRLACELIDGICVGGGESFSFNAVVGLRTKERGFCEAPVIVGGAFVQGVGGGVCQVSTTVYNGALLSGMGITEVHAHSLKVGYVSPSFDAMVSERCDLRFVNPARTPVAIFARAEEGRLTVSFFGRGDGFSYSTESRVTGIVPQPEAKVVDGEEELVLRSGRDGLRSEGYLIRTRRGRVKKAVRIRRDVYFPVQAVLQRPPLVGKEDIFDNKFEDITQNN